MASSVTRFCGTHSALNLGDCPTRRLDPSSIIYMKMKDFMTHPECEVRPGPRVNLVLGPNGSGKSSLVCALVLALGGSPTIVDRTSEPWDAVRKGCDSGFVEIHLYDARTRTKAQKLVLHLNKRKRKEMFTLNGRAVSKKEVKELVAQLNIKGELGE